MYKIQFKMVGWIIPGIRQVVEFGDQFVTNGDFAI